MTALETLASRLAEIPSVQAASDVPLSRYTRFGIGGPADVYAETPDADAFAEAWRLVHASGAPLEVIAGGTNLIVSDAGFRGVVLRYTGAAIEAEGPCVRAAAGASLWDLVWFTIDRGLRGLETLAGIPGSVGAAVYGNAGAYGHSISERITFVRFLHRGKPREFDNPACHFRYRESVFKEHKDWVILSAQLRLDPADAGELRSRAEEIVRIRNEKFPPTMRCAGSIFKNLLFDDLPESVTRQVPPGVVREGKIPAAWFLEQVGAKGIQHGGIAVADYHANLIFNAGSGTAAELRGLIAELKTRVRDRFGIEAEEEVQYVGFG